MKKQIISAMLVILTTACALCLASCDKDENKTCTCEEANSYGEHYSGQMSPSQFGVSTCEELARALSGTNSDYYYRCY